MKPQAGETSLRLNEWREGWRAVLASSIGYGAGLGVLSMTSSLFVKPMRDELGWSTKVVAFLPLTMLLVAVCTPIVGALVDRFGSRRIALIGMMAFGFSIGALAFIPPSQFALYTVAVILGIVGPMTSTTPFARCVATWFDRSAGTAFGLTMNGVSFLALFVVPLISAVIYAYGWRMGYLTLSLVILLFGFPVLYFLLHERPSPRPANLANAAADKYSGMRQVFADGRFWAVLVAIGFAGIPLGGFLGHLQPMLAAGGMPIAAATSLGVVFAISVTLGRVGGGVLLDRYWDGGVALTLLLLSAVGAVLLSSFGVTTPFWLIAFAVLLVGMGQGIEADFIAYFALKMFGMRKYSTVVAIYSMTAGLMMASGGFAFSVLFDAIGDYAIACLIGAGSFLISGVILFVTRMADRHSIRSAAQAI